MCHVELGKMHAVYGGAVHCELQALSSYNVRVCIHIILELAEPSERPLVFQGAGSWDRLRLVLWMRIYTHMHAY